MTPWRPTCYVFAGPNGAGKTTFAMRYLPAVVHCAEFINADSIAHGLSPFNEQSVQMQAGRLLLERIGELSLRHVDFAFETTLSGTGHVATFRRLKRAGYRVALFFLWIPSAEFSAQRVADRVAGGGHSIARDTLVRRFPRSLRNLTTRYLSLADYVGVWDNSDAMPHRVYERDETGEAVFDPCIWSQILEHGNDQDNDV
jgi:predicted ABC-type ATPase